MVARLLLLAFVALTAITADAMPASPWPVHEVQKADGTSVQIFVRGSEHFNWHEDEEGYTVVPVPREDGSVAYHYGMLDTASDTVVPTEHRVGEAAHPMSHGLNRRELPVKRGWKESAKKRLARRAATDQRRATPTTGIVKNLVIMMRFADHAARPLPTSADLGVLFNNVGAHPTLAPTGSVRDVWYNCSYAKLTVQSSFTGWIDISQNETTVGSNQPSVLTGRIAPALREAITKADALINFKDFDADGDGKIDMVTFIHSGYGGEWGTPDQYGTPAASRVWSHKDFLVPSQNTAEGVAIDLYQISPAVFNVSGSAITRIGAVVHEMGHFLGLPDLNDVSDPAYGIGNFGTMGNPWGIDSSQWYPPVLSAWSKIKLNWVTPTVITASGQYTATPAATTAQIFKIARNPAATEYFLLENRQALHTDAKIGTGGIAIYHIDDAAGLDNQGYPGMPLVNGLAWPQNGAHYRVAVVQSDGLYELEKGSNTGNSNDLWRVGWKYIINSNTVNVNTRMYAGGIVTDLGLNITVKSLSTTNMIFQVDFSNCGNQAFRFGGCGVKTLQSATVCIPSAGTCTAATCCL